MLHIFGLVFVAVFTYAVCLMEHKRTVRRMAGVMSEQYSAARNAGYKAGWNNCYEEIMPRVYVGDLKMTRETLACAQSLMRSYVLDCRPHTKRIGLIIEEIDKLRPLGPDGKHGNLHTDFCGCEDK